MVGQIDKLDEPGTLHLAQSPRFGFYSVLNELTGFAVAATIDR
jgi:hypothetical protein